MNIKKTLDLSSNILLLYSVIVAGFSIYDRIMIASIGGACPLPRQRFWLYSAIASAIIALILMAIKDHLTKTIQ